MVVKEIGCGIDALTGRRLFDAGVRILDTAGLGGTSWARIEAARAAEPELGEIFADWGVPTPDSIRALAAIDGLVVIGSGATAMTLVPAMAPDVAHITMLQRSPTYVVSRPDRDRIANFLRRVLPEKWAYAITRWKNITFQQFTYGLTRTRPEFITRRLESQPDQPLSYDKVVLDLERIQQLGEFETVDVRFVEDAGGTTLRFDARERSWGAGYLRLGLGVESNFDGDADFRGIVNYRRAEINRRGGEWKTVVAIGDPFEVHTELFQPLNLGGFHWFVAPGLEFTKDKEERFLPGGVFEVVGAAPSVNIGDAGD